MCGIAGVQTTDGSAPNAAALARMRVALAHRGPDGSALLVRGDTALLHLRLAIVDLMNGDQPLFGPGETALVANGEIYNDPDLRHAMADTPWRTRSDCEPPVFLYARDGLRFADALRGMYAIAIHEPETGRLVLARDPFGIKPLYYVASEEGFAFASEPAALVAGGFAEALVDPVRRAELLQLKFTTGARTILPAVMRVLPGETLVVQGGRILERHRREHPALVAAPPTEGVATTRRRAGSSAVDIGAVLFESVSAHLRADVPYGLFLSGGIDSAALLALMRQVTGSRIQAITVGWEGGSTADESAEASRLAAIAGADCERIVMTEADFWDVAPRVAAAMDDPTADAACLPTWLLARAARAGGLKVALSGEGADEMFGGYARYRKRRAPWRWVARSPRSDGLFPTLDMPGWRDGIAAAERAADPAWTAVQAAQAVDIAEWLPNDLLGKLDRMLMAHGVEGRTPFLDAHVAALAFPLSDRRKVSWRFGKVALRTWLADAFPQAGAFARKKGFKPPVGTWIFSRGTALADAVARQPGIAEAVSREVVLAAFGRAAITPQPAWSLLFYALWHQHHIVGRSPEGGVGEVLASASPQPSSSRKKPVSSMA